MTYTFTIYYKDEDGFTQRDYFSVCARSFRQSLKTLGDYVKNFEGFKTVDCYYTLFNADGKESSRYSRQLLLGTYK